MQSIVTTNGEHTRRNYLLTLTKNLKIKINKMKKFLFGLFSLLLVAGTISAQDGKKALKTATKAYGAYNLDPTKNADRMQEAIDALNIATAAGEVNGSSKVWQLKGDLFNSVYRNYATLKQLDPSTQKGVADAAVQAYAAYQKALELSQKKYETKDAVKGLVEVQSYLVGEGAEAYEAQDYATAYSAFKDAIDAQAILKDKGESGIFADAEGYNDQVYYTGLAALNAQDLDSAKPMFNQLREAGYDKPAVYEALYKIASASENNEEAFALLTEGREKFPDDVSLLFNEINHYLKEGKLDELTGRLDAAIAKEPDNPSLYSTLGNVYDNLYQKELEAKNEAKATEHFDSAFKNYNKALELKPGFFDAVYSIGALYYNRAAATTTSMNALADDYSKPGLKKYDELRKKMITQFDEALPFFKQAEVINPSDRNTLIALKEIFARKDDLTTSTEFKTRLETLEGGGTISDPFFKE